MSNSRRALTLAGILSFVVAGFQAVITFSPTWSRYFGAPEALVSNLPLLYAAGLAAALLFGVFGLYALSGAGHVRPLPLLRWGLLAIGSVYLLRGLFVIPLLLMASGHLRASESVPPSGMASSLVSLIIGIVYLAGAVGSWKSLGDGR